MPLTFQIDEAKRRLYSRAEGVVTYEDLRNHMNRPEPLLNYSELLDATDAAPNMSMQKIRDLADELRQRSSVHGPPGPIAFIAERPVMFGMLRMYDSLTNDIRPIHVFRKIEDAENWLDTVGTL
jgi:hypothetical protein